MPFVWSRLKQMGSELSIELYQLSIEQRQAARDRDRERDRDDDWSHNPDMNSEDDPSEIVSTKHFSKCYFRYFFPFVQLQKSGNYSV